MSDTHPDGGGSGPEPLDSVVSRAVEMGYKVIEDQIRQGQRVAEQLTQGNIDAGMVNGNVSEMLERVLHFYSDMSALCFDMMESVFRHPALGQWMNNVMPDGAAKANGHHAEDRSNGRGSVPVEIICTEATGARVLVELHADHGTAALAVEPLRSRTPGKPPVEQVVVLPRQDAWETSLQVTIPAGQPAGTYSGIIYNTVSDEPAGTVCLHIPEKEQGSQER